MSDLISRQEAIDAIEFGITYAKAIDPETGEVKELFQASNDELRKAEDRIKHLPSAEPEIIRCRDCKYWDTTWESAWAKDYHYCPLIDGTSKGDWYCADAERKEL